MEKNQGQAQPLLLVCEDLKKALAWRDALELGGLATELETNGMVGLDRALSGRFRLILLDQRLASIDCVGVYRRIRHLICLLESKKAIQRLLLYNTYLIIHFVIS